MKKTINSFLHFDGNCKQAIEYYKDIFNGNFKSEEEINVAYFVFTKDVIKIREKFQQVFCRAKYVEFIHKFSICYMLHFDYK